MDNSLKKTGIQKMLFDEILKRLSPQHALVDVISDLLGISNDASYRRIRCDKIMDIEEVALLCSRLHLSLDELLYYRTEASDLSYSKTHYDIFIHLPIEFPMTNDGHRPVSERFRASCNTALENTYKELGLPVYNVSGNMKERLGMAIRYLGLPQTMDTNEAIYMAHREVRERFNNIRLETV